MKNSSNIDQITLLNIQEVASFCYLITTAVAIYLTHYRKQTVQNRSTMITPEEARRLNIFNHFAILILTSIFLYVNFITLQNARENQEDTTLLSLQSFASILTTIGAIIVLYVVIQDPIDNPSSNENPEI